MIYRTYINKFNTLIEDSSLNTGINPVAELVYGANVSRIICYFDHSKLKEMVDSNIFPDMSKLHHTLRITNAGSIDFTELHCNEFSSIGSNRKRRATSFDIIFFLIPKFWDRGKGFDYSRTAFNRDFYDTKSKHYASRLVSTDGSNWYKARNGYDWDEPGIYSNDTLSREYDNFSSEEGSVVIIGRQHFDIGNENINLDITNVVNKFITGELENYGIGIAYSPQFERVKYDKTDKESYIENYCGFLTDKTNTFFAPFVETYYDDYISDDRSNFVLDKNNKLYLYSTIGDKLTDLDNVPTCIVRNDYGFKREYDVKHQSRGVYYIDITLPHGEFEPDTMLFDTWGNISYGGVKLDDVELDFTVKRPSVYFNIGNSIEDEPDFTPSVFGIKSDEEIKRGDIRKLGVITRVNYTKTMAASVDSIELRLYVRDGTRELDVIPFDRMNKTMNETFTVLDTNMLLPQKYYVDVKINYGMQSIIHHDMLHFKIIGDLNNKYA